jgi:2-polyprenyl-3-methyl-5-hydroxy-6-metoxy-1,4-benzoquinol methylase
MDSWSQLYQHRRQVARRFGRIYDLPLARRVRQVLLEQVSPRAAVLEVGAGDRHMREHLAAVAGVTYESMDIDPAGEHDYRSLDQITRRYDCIAAFEVVEHLPLDQIVPWLSQLSKLLNPGGRLILSTPNTFYPPAYLRDATHRTPLCYDELGGLVELAGLSVERIVRIYNDPLWRYVARRYLFGWLFRLIGLDFARQIVLVAQSG